LVNAFVKRSDLQLDIDLWVVDGSVQAFWMHAVDGASEIAIVKRWLEALKNRDARALSQLTLAGQCGARRSTSSRYVCRLMPNGGSADCLVRRTRTEPSSTFRA
jgi:hypothetical protein